MWGSATGMESIFGRGNLLTIWNAGMSTTTRKRGEFTTQRLPMQLLREDQCVVRFKDACSLRCGKSL